MDNAQKPAYPVEVDVEGVPKDSGTYERLMDKARELGNGLTKRERFAMAAMQGLLSDSESVKSAMIALEQNGFVDDPDNTQIVIASNAVAFADALLKELGETQ